MSEQQQVSLTMIRHVAEHFETFARESSFSVSYVRYGECRQYD